MVVTNWKCIESWSGQWGSVVWAGRWSGKPLAHVKLGLDAQTGDTRAGVALGLGPENFDISPIWARASPQVERGSDVYCTPTKCYTYTTLTLTMNLPGRYFIPIL